MGRPGRESSGVNSQVEHLAVVPAAVGEQGQQAGDALDDLAVHHQLGRDLLTGAGGGYGGGQLVLADQLCGPCSR